MSQQIISNIVKEYPTMLKIIIYHNSYQLNTSRIPKERKVKVETDLDRSLRRTRSTIEDLILCNNFDLWCTFTFNPKKIDRFDHIRCKLVMRKWLENQRSRNSPNLKYLVVPELHKDGAIHFHALLANYKAPLKDSGKHTRHNQKIYSAPKFLSGFTQFIKLDNNKEPLARYITKQYITKDMPLFLAKQRYYASQNLTRPTHHVNGLSKLNLWKIVQNHKPEYTTQSYEIQYHPKTTTMDSGINVSLLPSLL